MTVNGNLTNTINAGAVTTTNGVTNADPVQASLTNLPGASISKSFSPNPIPANSYSTLTITIKNTGNIELVKMGMIDSLPAGLKIAAASTPAPVNNCSGTLSAVAGTQLIELTDGTLAGNSTCTILVSITGSTPGDYKNTIPVGGLKADPLTQNNEPATASLTITASSGGGRGGSKTTTSAKKFLIPVTGFQAGVVTNLNDVPHETYLATGDVMLEIPGLGVKIPIVGVPKNNGTWNVAWLGDQAGWLEGSAFPSWSGNSILTGHVYSASGLPGPFVNLGELKFGDKIMIHAYGQKYIFEVQTNTIVAPNDTSVMKHEDKPWLTLVTCKDYDAKTQTYLSRVVVRAVLTRVDWE
jgi:LPXTG-site transpeptidase (sortase) family protein